MNPCRIFLVVLSFLLAARSRAADGPVVYRGATLCTAAGVTYELFSMSDS